MLSRGAPAHLALNLFGKFVLGTLQIVLHLEAKPEIGRRTEILREPKRRVRRDGALALHDFEDPVRRDTQINRKLVDAGAGGRPRTTSPRLLRARLNVALNLRLVLPRSGARIVGAL
jgi:hypothetical protein